MRASSALIGWSTRTYQRSEISAGSTRLPLLLLLADAVAVAASTVKRIILPLTVKCRISVLKIQIETISIPGKRGQHGRVNISEP